MTSRERIQAAMEHRETDRIPYFIQLTCETAERIKEKYGVDDVESWLDNDVLRINMPWWDWHNLDTSWKSMHVPTTRPCVRGIGNYDNLAENIKFLRDTCDKYFLVAIYGCHFEKAYFGLGLVYYKKNEFEMAERNFIKVVELNPNDFLGNFYLGKISLSRNKFDESKKYLEKSR